jgi:hypothetical protein
LHLLDGGNHHAGDLHEDAGRDIGHDAEGEDRRVRKSAADEEIVQTQQSALALVLEEVSQGHDIDTGCRDVRADSVDDETEQREHDLVTQLGGVVDVADCRRGG